jgi:hypothetical protein
MGRNLADSIAPRGVSSLSPGGGQVGQHEQILDAEARAPLPEAQVRISGNDIGPSDGHGAEGAIWVLERDAVLAPELLSDDEPERLVPQGVKRMDDPNQRRINGTRCS